MIWLSRKSSWETTVMGNSWIGLRRGAMYALSFSAFVICALATSLAFANNNIGLKTIPLHITNQMNSGQDVYVWIFGITNTDTPTINIGTNVYVTNRQGDVAITP